LSVFLVFSGNVFSQEKLINSDVLDASLARKIALHTFLTNESGPLIDASENELQAVLAGASSYSATNAVKSTIDATVALKALLAPSKVFGYSSALFIFSPSKLSHPALEPQFIIWMPKSVATDGKVASKVLVQKLQESMANSLPEGYSLQEYEVAHSPLFGREYKSKKLSLVGPGCPTSKDLECRVGIMVNKPIVTDVSPEWLKESGGAYFWKNWEDGSTSLKSSVGIGVYLAKHGKDLSEGVTDWMDKHQEQLFLRMSKNLEDWVYIYLPPTLKKPYPVIFNSGDKLFFVKGKVGLDIIKEESDLQE